MPHSPSPIQPNQRVTIGLNQPSQEESGKVSTTGNETHKKARRKREPEAESRDRENVLDAGSKGT